MHHVAIRTADILRAIAFYEILGFTVTERFTAGMTLACWMEGWKGRIELMQVPNPTPPPDPFADEGYVGYYHLSLDFRHGPHDSREKSGENGISVTLPQWLDRLQKDINDASASQTGGVILNPLTILLPPEQQMIGSQVYEVAFIADSDGLPIEVLNPLTPKN